MAFDPHPNHRFTTVFAPPATPLAGTTLTPTDTSLFPDPASEGAYNAIAWAANEFPVFGVNVEIIRVTSKNILTGELTISRTQEGSVNRAILPGDFIAIAPTEKVWEDIERRIDPNTIVLGASTAYPATQAGFAAAVAAMPSTGGPFNEGGGVIRIPSNTEITITASAYIQFARNGIRLEGSGRTSVIKLGDDTTFVPVYFDNGLNVTLTWYNLTANAPQGQDYVDISAANLATLNLSRGDTIIVANVIGTAGTDAVGFNETCEVRYIEGQGRIWLNNALRHTYNTAQTARVTKLTPLKRCSISNLTIDGNNQPGYHHGVLGYYMVDCEVDVWVRNFTQSGIFMQGGLRNKINMRAEDQHGLPDGNMVTNYSFEDSAGAFTSTGWSGFQATLSDDAVNFKFGAHALKLTATVAGGEADALYVASISATGGTTGRKFGVGLWIYAPAAVVGKQARIEIGESGGASGAAQSIVASTNLVAGWNYLATAAPYTVVANDRTAIFFYVKVANVTNIGDTYTIDNVVLQELRLISELQTIPTVSTGNCTMFGIGETDVDLTVHSRKSASFDVEMSRCCGGRVRGVSMRAAARAFKIATCAGMSINDWAVHGDKTPVAGTGTGIAIVWESHDIHVGPGMIQGTTGGLAWGVWIEGGVTANGVTFAECKDNTVIGVTSKNCITDFFVSGIASGELTRPTGNKAIGCHFQTIVDDSQDMQYIALTSAGYFGTERTNRVIRRLTPGGVILSNSAAESDVLATFSIPAYSLGNGVANALHFRDMGYFQNGSGAACTLRVRVYWNGVAVIDFTSPNIASNNFMVYEFTVDMSILNNTNVYFSGTFKISTATGLGVAGFNANNTAAAPAALDVHSITGVTAANLVTAQSLRISAQSSVANAAINMVRSWGDLQLVA